MLPICLFLFVPVHALAPALCISTVNQDSGGVITTSDVLPSPQQKDCIPIAGGAYQPLRSSQDTRPGGSETPAFLRS